jgi:hypothetical protein
VAGMSSPSAFAVLRLISSSYRVGACTGKVCGLLASEDAIHVAGRLPVLVQGTHQGHHQSHSRQTGWRSAMARSKRADAGSTEHTVEAPISSIRRTAAPRGATSALLTVMAATRLTH